MSQATRDNASKLRWTLLDYDAIEEAIKVLEWGADHYGEKNWQKGLNQQELQESTQRHLKALIGGQVNDPITGLPHEAHIICNAMFYSFHRRNKSFSKKRNNPFKTKTNK